MNTTKIVITFLFLWITTQSSIVIENTLAYVLILSLGVLHGSNDLKLLKIFYKNKNKNNFNRIFFLYVLTMFVTFSFFLIIPNVGLLFFIILSSYHFGEQHLINKIVTQHTVRYAVFTFYGLLIFSMIFYIHADEVLVIMRDVTDIYFSKTFFKYSLVTFAALLAFCLMVVRKSKKNSFFVFEEIAYLLLFFIVFKISTLLWSFAIYFVIWHSLPSLKDQINILYGPINKLNIWKYLKSSLPYWIVSILGIFILSEFTKNDLKLFNLLFVALLAAITFPHTIVLGKMHLK